MKKYFCVSDVHGHFDELKLALDNAGFNPDDCEHFFVSCGDLLDRGKQPAECLKFVNTLPRKILIRGNHEDLMEDLLKNRCIQMHDVHNGTSDTLFRLTHTTPRTYDVDDAYHKMETHPEWVKYIKSVINYYETPKYIFVHGWIPCTEFDKFSGNVTGYDSNWRNAQEDDWRRSRWYAGWKHWNAGIREPDKTIICGHWHCSAPNYFIHHEGKNEYDCTEPFIDNGIIDLDACTVLSKKVNCIVLEDE